VSDKLVVEFYDSVDTNVPTACVLAYYGGDNPSQAATTLTDFFTALSGIPDPRFDDAGLLAARFVAWEGQRYSTENPFDFLAVTIIPPHQSHGCQVARIYAGRSSHPRIEFVRDQYTTTEEIEEAKVIIGATLGKSIH
jgi:hypothetical protein